MDRRQGIKKLIFVIVFLLLVLVFVYSGLRILESTIFMEDEIESVEPIVSKTITRDGIDYYPRQDLEILLVMGTDKFGPVEDSGSYNNDGEADTLMLLIFDQTDESLSILHLNRDTMVEMPVLGIGGKKAGTMVAQLALAHTFGSGLEDSGENTRDVVSDLLYGIHIDHYISMNMDAVSLINDAVGGVTVQVVDDFSAVDASIGMGEVTLHGEQAISFVRSRGGMDSQLNVTRMERQKEYMDKFIPTLIKKTDEDSSLIFHMYDDISKYMVTDCTIHVVTSMLERYSDYPVKEIVIPEGENVLGTEFMEFHLDEEKMDDLIVRLFYEPKE